MAPEINFALIVGSYLFTAWVFRYFSNKIETVLKNHLATIEKRLNQLEDKV